MRSGSVFHIFLSFALFLQVVPVIDHAQGGSIGSMLTEENSFSIVLLPDTQIYSRYYPDIYYNQTEWIVDHRDEYNIEFVLHEGDITNNNNHPQWLNASRAMYLLNDTVPYTLNPGNHDLGPNGNAVNRNTYLNDYFPSGPIENWGSWGGAFENGHQENTYHLFSAGGRKWLVMALEFAPRDAVLEWANEVVDMFPDRLVLVVTHNYLVANQRMPTLGGDYGLGSSPDGAATGEEIWQEFVKDHQNIMCIFCGHILQESGYLESRGTYGNTVFQMMANFQMNTMGGEGFLRIVTFDMDEGTFDVRTYSPYLDEYRTEPEHRFAKAFRVFEYINDGPIVKNPISEFRMVEDQGSGFIDVDGNSRPLTGIFSDINVEQGDELKTDIWTGSGWHWLGPGSPFQKDDIGFFYIANGTVKIEAPGNLFGSFPIGLRARDSRGASVDHNLTLTVLSVNDPPELLSPFDWEYSDPEPEVSAGSLMCDEDEWLNFTVRARDLVEPSDILTCHILTEDRIIEKILFDNQTGEFSLLPGNDDVGTHPVTFSVDDGTDEARVAIIIKVVNVNDAPEIVTGSLPDAVEDVEYSFTLEAIDIDPTGDKLKWSMVSNASNNFLYMDERTGELMGNPQNGEGSCWIEVSVNDGKGGSDSTELYLKVAPTNDPPEVVDIPPAFHMKEDSEGFISPGPWFRDIDGDELAYEAEFEEGSTMGSMVAADVLDNGSVRLRAGGNWSGNGLLKVTASDPSGESVSLAWTISVGPVNDAPYDLGYELGFETAVEGGWMNVTGTAEDLDLEYGDSLSFSWYSNVSGALGSGERIDLALPAGFHLITMEVKDSEKESAFIRFALEVLPEPDEGDQDDDINDDVVDDRGGGAVVIVLSVSGALVLGALIGVVLVLYLRKRWEGENSVDRDKMVQK